MIRNDPMTSVDVLGGLDGDPVKYVGDFVDSRLASKIFGEIKIPVWDTVGDSLEEIYMNSRRNHDAMIRQLDVVQENQQLQSIANTNRIYNLNRDFANLREQFLKTNLFIREFAEKRRLTMKKFRRELEITKEIKSTSEEIRNNLCELAEFREILRATAEDYKAYESVLEDVVSQSKTFGSVKDLINHCDSLMLTQLEIYQLNEEKVNDLETIRKRFIVIAKDAALEVLGLKNTLSSIDRFYEISKYECFNWEKTLKKAIEATDYILREQFSVLSGVKHLYKSLCQRRGIIPTLLRMEDRLNFIKDEVQLLQEVVAECNEENQIDV